MSPQVSVVIPTLGRESLSAAVRSVRRQGVDVQIVLVDDSGVGAVDESQADDVVVIRTEGRQGAAHARNLGMRAAAGDFIAFLDDDDEWLDGHLLDALSLFVRRPEIDVYAARGLVLQEDGTGRIEPAVLLGDRTVAEYFFERATWRSRSRRLLTPTLVFRRALAEHDMDTERSVNEDTWWLLTAERDRGARVAQSPHIAVVVHGSAARTTGRWRDDLGTWFDDADIIHPGGAGAEMLAMFGRPAVRAGRPSDMVAVGRRIVTRPGGRAWAPVVAAHIGAAAGVAAVRRARRR